MLEQQAQLRYEQIIRDLQSHSEKAEEVYRLQIEVLKEKLRDREELIQSLSHPLDESAVEDRPPIHNNIQIVISEYGSVDKQDLSRLTILENSQDATIVRETRQLKMELNELFKAKELEAEEFNRHIKQLEQENSGMTQKHTQELNRMAIQMRELKIAFQEEQNKSEHINRRLLQLERARDEAEEKCQKVKGQMTELKSLLVEKEQTLAQSMNRLSEKQKQVSSLRAECGQAIAKSKEAELKVEEMLQHNEDLLDELLELRKEKEIKREHTEKQHRLILQYEKKSEEDAHTIKDLEAELLEKAAAVKQIQDTYVQKYKGMVLKYSAYIQEIVGEFKYHLQQMKTEVAEIRHSVLGWIKAQGPELKLICDRVCQAAMSSDMDTSVSRIQTGYEGVLKFENDELKKELLQLKAEITHLKYQKKRVQEKQRKLSELTSKQTEPPLLTEDHKPLAVSTKVNQKQELLFQTKLKHLFNVSTNEKKPDKVFSELASKTARIAVRDHLAGGNKGGAKTARKSSTDERIIQSIIEMRQRIKNVREECKLRDPA